VCQKHNVLIIEDDAYYWLQFYKGQEREQQQQQCHRMGQEGEEDVAASSSHSPRSDTAGEVPPAPSSAAVAVAVAVADVPGLQLPASFLSIDTDGRVIRVDTLSKLMGPG
jgi:DNA-binding transcriptional MocR family regulator